MTLARKGLIVSLGAYATIVVQLAQAMILSRALGPDGSGELYIFRNTFVLGTQIASMGLPMAMIHAVNSSRIGALRALKTVVNFSLLMSVVSVAILSAVMYYGSDRFSEHSQFGAVNWQIFLSTALIVPSVLLYNVYLNFNASRLDATKLALITFIPPAMLVSWYAISWKIFGLNVGSTALAESIIRGVLGMTAAWWLSRRAIKTLQEEEPQNEKSGLLGIDWKFTCSQIPFGLQMVATDFLVLFNGYLLGHVLKFFTNETQVGYYSRGLRLATLTILAVQAMQRLLYANWAKLEGVKLKRSVEKVINACVILAIILSAVVALAAKPLTLILFGEEFLPAVPVTRMALIGLAAYMVIRLLQSYFNALRKTYYNILVLAGGTAGSFAFSLYLIPKYQAIGAINALNIGYFTMLIIALYISCGKCGLSAKAMLIPSKDLIERAVRKIVRRKITTNITESADEDNSI